MSTRGPKPTKRTRRTSQYPSPFDPQPADAPESAADSPQAGEAGEVAGAHKMTAGVTGEGMSRVEEEAIRLAAAHPAMPNATIGRTLGLSENSQIVRRLGVNGDLRAHVRALLAGVGLDDKALVRKWAQLVQAKEVRHFAYQGKVLDTRHVVALDTRLKALENVTKLARLYPATTEDQDQKTVGPPALMIQLNLGTTSQTPSPSGVTIALGPSPEVPDAQGETPPG